MDLRYHVRQDAFEAEKLDKLVEIEHLVLCGQQRHYGIMLRSRFCFQ